MLNQRQSSECYSKDSYLSDTQWQLCIQFHLCDYGFDKRMYLNTAIIGIQGEVKQDQEAKGK